VTAPALSLVKPALPPVRFHQLKRVGRAPALFRAEFNKESSDIDKGTALHSVLLKGKRVTFYPEVTKTGNAAPRNGEKWEAFEAANADALILTRTEYEEVQRMADAVRAHKEAMEVLAGKPEDTLLFDYCGRPCRTTPDVRGYDHVTELKKTRNAHPRAFKYQALSMRYHAQVAFHRLGAELAGHGRPERCYFVAVEDRPPWPAVVMPLSARALAAGQRLIDAWLSRLLECERTGEFPSYQAEAFDVTDQDEQSFGADVRD
jgi:hypothetical protein